MRKTLACVVTGAAALCIAPVHAQDVGAPPNGSAQPTDTAGQTDLTGTASAAPNAQGTPEQGVAKTSDEIVVLGFGQSRQVQSVTAADIARLTPGSSPLKAIEKLPGVNFQAADPFGAYEWAVRISLRGFSQNQLGFTLDGVPLGDMSYGNVNGLHISRAIISENLARIEVAQGAGALGTASTSNLGGTIEFFSDTPRDGFDVTGSGTYGSDDTYRAYARLDTGLVGPFKAYLSYGFLKTDKWKGNGPQRANQANAKVVADLGALGTISGFFDFSARRETDYQDLTIDLVQRLGRDAAFKVDNINPNYALAEQIATAYQTGAPYPAPYRNVDDVYYDAGGLRNDYLSGVTFDAHLSPAVTWRTTGYYHVNRGQGSWFTPYVATPLGAPDTDGTPIADPAPISFRTTNYGIHRGGLISAISFETGANALQVGGWYESNDFRQYRRYYGLTADAPNRSALEFQDNPFLTQYAGRFQTDTYQYFVADTIKLADDRLVLDGGWKGVHAINRARIITGPQASGRIDAKDLFQPQVGVVYHVTPSAELFANYKENMRAFVAALTAGPFSTTQAGFDSLIGNLKPEKSKTAEGGVRFRAGGLQASMVGYYIDFTNRLASFANGSGILGNPAILNNVGSVHAYGGEAALNYRIAGAVSLFANYSYNHSEYRDNVLLSDGSVYAYTKGKTVIDAPRHMVKGEVVYDDGSFFGRVGGDYMSKRYFSYENDLVAGGRFVGDASIGYRFTGPGWLHGVSIEGSVTNFTDRKYIGTVNTNNVQVRCYGSAPNAGIVNAPGCDADNPNFMVGPPRQWFVTLKKGF